MFCLREADVDGGVWLDVDNVPSMVGRIVRAVEGVIQGVQRRITGLLSRGSVSESVEFNIVNVLISFSTLCRSGVG